MSPQIKGVDIDLVAILPTAGKKALTHRWMMQVRPRVCNLINIYRMEKVTFSPNLRLEMFRSPWAKWVEYIRPVRPNFVD